jgi:hypothetical protein
MISVDEDVVDLIFAGTVDYKGVAFDRADKIMTRQITAASHDIAFQFERIETDFLMVIRVADNGAHAPFSDAKA